MKEIYLKKFRLVFISAVLIVSGMIVWACADWESEPPSNFAPEVFVDSSLSPFYFDSYNFYYGGYNEVNQKKFSETNASEWQFYFENKIDRNTLKNILDSSSQGVTDSLFAVIENGSKKAVQGIPGFSSCNSKKVKKFFAYLHFAKMCETFANKEPYRYWDENKAKPVLPEAQLYKDIENAFSKEKDIFIKERYWFQLVRCEYFLEKYKESFQCFDDNKKRFVENNIYYRTMEYAAGSLYKQKEYGRANYYYSLVFSANDVLKTSAHFSFHPQEEADWQQTLSLCTCNKEKETLWQMLGVFYKDEFRSLKEIYAVNSKSSCMDILLVRLINKMEEGNADQYGDSTRNINLPEAYNWVKSVADNANTSNPFLWYISAGYISFNENKFTIAAEYYKKAEKILPSSALAGNQLRILKTVNKVAACKEMNSTAEAALLEDLSWLYKLQASDKNILRFTNAQSWVRRDLAKKYKFENKEYQSECFLSDKNFYTDNNNIEKLKAFYLKTNKTGFEQLMASLSEKKYDDLLAYQATIAAYKNNISEAITLMEKSKTRVDTLRANPFNGRINDCHDCDFAAPQKQKYTKLGLLLKLQEMEKNIEQNLDVYTNAVLIGNAFYNISHYGNARFFYEGMIIGTDMCCASSIDSVFVTMLTSMEIPEKYYQIALKAATTEEQKAKATYLLAKCERNDYYNGLKPYSPWETPDVYYARDYFSKLKQFSKTQYYKEVIKECGYFRSYLSSK